MREADIQNAIRRELSMKPDCTIFRANCGMAWTGNDIRHEGTKVTIYDARPFKTGLPAGFSDLFGITPVIINERHLDKLLGIATFIEVKCKTKPSANQLKFIKNMQKTGSLAGIAYSVEDALKIISR